MGRVNPTGQHQHSRFIAAISCNQLHDNNTHLIPPCCSVVLCVCAAAPPPIITQVVDMERSWVWDHPHDSHEWR